MKDMEEFEEMIEDEIITLTMDDGETVRCAALGIFEAENEKEYIAFLPVDGDDADSGQVYLYRYSEDENGEPILENIVDDDEFEIAAEAFDEMMDELDELADEE